jgi:hypothetical protein
MRVRQEYGIQSVNSTLATIREIVVDIINNHTNKIMGSSHTSGYSIGTNYVWDGKVPYVEDQHRQMYYDADTIKYLNFPYPPVQRALDDVCSLYSALGNPVHWIILNNQLYLAPVPDMITRDHSVKGATDGYSIESVWASVGPPLYVKRDMIASEFSLKESEANYVLSLGTYEYPVNEYYTEGHADEWDTTLVSGVTPIEVRDMSEVYYGQHDTGAGHGSGGGGAGRR